MSAKDWFVHLEGETNGPLSTERVGLLIQQKRLQFADFIWAAHLTKWHRISDLDEFIGLMPSYPKVPVPSREVQASEPSQAKAVPARLGPAASEAVEKRPEKKEARKEEARKAVKAKPAEKSWPKTRRFVRTPLLANERVTLADVEYALLNVSEGGIFLESSVPLSIGTEVKFTLQLVSMEKGLDMTGIVIRHGNVAGHDGFAVEFTRINPAHKRILAAYIQQFKESE